MRELDELINSVIDGSIDRTLTLTRQALDGNIPAKEILDSALEKAMNTIGDRFARQEIFFPELLMAGEAMKEALNLLKGELSKDRGAYLGKCVIGTVQGDVHDIGKNIVIMMLEGNGWDVTDLGIDVPPEQFCQAVADGDFDIVGIGAYVSLSLPNMEKTVLALKEAGLRDRVKIMVGGVPVTQAFADQIGADAYGETAIEAVTKARDLIKR